MFQKLLNIWRPEVYHGKGEKATYFEGWFYKLVDSSQKNSLAVIPGIFINKKEQQSHAFIQILNGTTHRSYYQTYPLSEFHSAPSSFTITVGPNSFSRAHLELNIRSELQLTGRLNFKELKNWPVRWLSPGAMGWYAFVPFMECYHGILSLDHHIDGELHLNEQSISFEDGRGYIEKDWGKSFPQAYIWMQCNHFDQAGISLTLSIAKIPWLKGSFRGFIIGFLYHDRLYRFTTYNGAVLKQVRTEQETVHLEVVHQRHRLQIKASYTEAGVLHGPYDNKMMGRVAESLSSMITVAFYEKDRNGEKLLYSGRGQKAGLEINGALEQIIDS
jgi:tocopherol cyclase